MILWRNNKTNYFDVIDSLSEKNKMEVRFREREWKDKLICKWNNSQNKIAGGFYLFVSKFGKILFCKQCWLLNQGFILFRKDLILFLGFSI